MVAAGEVDADVRELFREPPEDVGYKLRCMHRLAHSILFVFDARRDVDEAVDEVAEAEDVHRADVVREAVPDGLLDELHHTLVEHCVVERVVKVVRTHADVPVREEQNTLILEFLIHAFARLKLERLHFADGFRDLVHKVLRARPFALLLVELALLILHAHLLALELEALVVNSVDGRLWCFFETELVLRLHVVAIRRDARGELAHRLAVEVKAERLADFRPRHVYGAVALTKDEAELPVLERLARLLVIFFFHLVFSPPRKLLFTAPLPRAA